LDGVIDEAEGSGLGAVAEDCKWFISKGLQDEIADDAAIVGAHTGAVGVEDAGYADIDAVFAVVIEHEGFGDAFAFVVATPWANWVYVAPVVFFLGVFYGITVDFGGAGLQDAGFDVFGEVERVNSAHY